MKDAKQFHRLRKLIMNDVRELVEDHRLRVTFVRSVDNLADIFTKALPAHAFFSLRDQIMNVPMHMRESSEYATTGGR